METKSSSKIKSEKIVEPLISKQEQRHSNDKWTPQVNKLGYTIVPSLLLRAQAKLNLSPDLLNVLIHLIEHWWEADKNPYPTKDTIATRMGKSPRQVQRYITELENRKFIQRIKRFRGVKAQTSNGYSLTGLVEKLKVLEPEFRKVAESNRLRRKKAETPTSKGV